MPTLLYSATMSLDGFIAGPDGDMQWLTPYLDDPNPVADDLVPAIGSLLIGARTFRGDDPNAGTDAEGAFGGTWEGPSVVLTHHPPPAPVPGTTFSSDLTEAVHIAQDLAGDKRYVNVLGADIARQCLDADLLDEILVFVAPVLLGGGVRLYAGDGPVGLERIDTSTIPLNLAAWYRVPH